MEGLLISISILPIALGYDLNVNAALIEKKTSLLIFCCNFLQETIK